MADYARKGVVTGCKRLNVRASGKEGSLILNVLERGTIVEIDPDTIGNKFYKIRATRRNTRPALDEIVEGYCMRDYISIVADEYTKQEFGVTG